jgi:pyrroloquinoline quinone biosynthesis protein E
MPEPCRSCDRREIDWGGCRCQAFALTGAAANTDPACAKSVHHYLLDVATRGVQDDAAAAGYVYRRIGAIPRPPAMPPVPADSPAE